MELPEECWELIFRSIDHHRYHESLSLVSSTFLAITDRLRSTLTITDQTVPFLPRLLRRFPNLKRIKFRDFYGDLNQVLIQISLSGLDIESVDVSGIAYLPDMAKSGLRMMNLKEFNCSRVGGLTNSHLVAIGMCFPFLEELDISHPIKYRDSWSYFTDSGLIDLSSTLKRLHKINISGNVYLTDRSLLSLSQNCVFLTEIIGEHCPHVTPDYLSSVFRNSQNLKSIAFGCWLSRSIKLFPFSGSLSEITLRAIEISDEFLCLMVDANFPLKKLALSYCCSFTFDGILKLLSKYNNLVHLDLQDAYFLSDEMIMKLGIYIRGLTFLNLSYCYKLTDLAFISIIQHCLQLKCLRMEFTNFGAGEAFSQKQEIIKTGIQSLYITNVKLSNECLKKVLYHCPHLELIDLTDCRGFTDYGILEITKNCSEIRSLNISWCMQIKNIPADFDLPKLEILEASYTAIDDEALDTISRRCPRLQTLGLENCLNVTARGLKEIARKCRRLRVVRLWKCEVDEKDLIWMVRLSSSLRYVVHPYSCLPTRDLKDVFLRHGCVICSEYSYNRFVLDWNEVPSVFC